MTLKKWFCGALLALVMLLPLSGALAAEAMDITGECALRCSPNSIPSKNLTDGKYTTKAKLKKVKHPWVSISAPAGVPIHGLYVCFASMPESYEIQVDYGNGAGWERYMDGETRFYHVYIPLNGVQNVRLYCTSDAAYEWSFNELFVFSEGTLPEWVQIWEPTPEKADILFLSTHPDDELIFFGGAIPTYAAEQRRSVVVAYMSYSNTTRRSELLNGLWHMGLRTYPVIGTFRDAYSKNAAAAYKTAGGESKVLDYVIDLYRTYRPEVVVTQDIDGEYGHGQHKMTVDAAQRAVALAAEEGGAYLDSFLEHGAWGVKKLYLHLYPENQLTFDWSLPLQSMGGKSGIQLAEEAYAFHVTQRGSGMSVTETGSEYDNRVFGLAYTAVGPDVRKDDFLENIYEPASFVPITPTPAPTPAPTPVPAYVAVMPALNEQGYLDDGEFIYSSDEQGLWVFVNQNTKIIISRRFDEAKPLTWFEADIWTDVAAGSRLNTIANDPEKLGKVRADAAETAVKHQVVFAMNADYYTYRVNSHNGRHTGVIIRDGQILYDDPVPQEKATKSLFPNLDMAAFYPDGRLEVMHSWEKTAQQLVDEGAYTVLSFGPYLLKDGELSERVYTSNDSQNPRCAIGMVEPGHYVAIMAEGRLKGRSAGITMAHLAQLMRGKGCTDAINLDGGQTAVMCFMGKQLNKIGKYDGGKTAARKTSEVLGAGFSNQVGTYAVDVQ